MTHPSERPEGEREAFERAWRAPRGWRLLSAVNNTHIGVFYIATAMLFFVLAGILGLMMRAQLAVPDNNLIGAQTYNQIFTMHGTVMMFLFAVPSVEAIAVYLLPGMLGARDLPFPRLTAYAFWAYAIGGLAFFCTIFFGESPDGGWFMYPPLTSKEFSPGRGADWWLLGIGFNLRGGAHGAGLQHGAAAAHGGRPGPVARQPAVLQPARGARVARHLAHHPAARAGYRHGGPA